MLLQQAESAEEKVSGKTFEEVIGELDEEINKYDSKGSVAIRVDANTEKENVGDQHTINEASMPCSPSHATNISLQKRLLFASKLFRRLQKAIKKIAFSTASLFRRQLLVEY